MTVANSNFPNSTAPSAPAMASETSVVESLPLRDITNEVASTNTNKNVQSVWCGTRTRFDQEGNVIEVIKASKEEEEVPIDETPEQSEDTEEEDEETSSLSESETEDDESERHGDLWSYREPRKEKMEWCGTHIFFADSESEDELEERTTEAATPEVEALQMDFEKLHPAQE